MVRHRVGDLNTARHKAAVLRKHCAEVGREALTHLSAVLIGETTTATWTVWSSGGGDVGAGSDQGDGNSPKPA